MATLAVWALAAWLLSRTSVPSLHLSGFDESRFFSPHVLARARRYSRGEDVLWLGKTAASLVTLVVLVLVLPRTIRRIGLGRIGAAIVAALVVLVTLWFVELPFGVAGQWWQHRYHLGPLGIGPWLLAQWSGLATEAVALTVGVALVVWLAARFRRSWWLPAAAAIVAIAAAFAFAGGYLAATGTHPLGSPALRGDVDRLEATEHVRGTPVSVQDVSSWTKQVNAFTTGFGPSSHVVLWNTLLDGRLSRAEIDVVVAHELGHVRSGHVAKAVGWGALVVFPVLFVLAWSTRRRGGLANPTNVPLAFLVLALLALVTAPLQNLVSRRYEAEADWRALNATHDPAAARGVFEGFARTSLEDPDPPLWDYLWLENHPTLMQRVAMTEAWAARRR